MNRSAIVNHHSTATADQYQGHLDAVLIPQLQISTRSRRVNFYISSIATGRNAAPAGGNAMTYDWIATLAVLAALGLFAYLGYALLRPEKF